MGPIECSDGNLEKIFEKSACGEARNRRFTDGAR